MKTLIFIIILFLLFFIPTCSAQVENGFFNDGLNNWTHSCSGTYGICELYLEEGHPYSEPSSGRVYLQALNGDDGASYITQTINVTGYNTLRFYAHGSPDTSGEYRDALHKYYIGGFSGVITKSVHDYYLYTIDISSLSDEQELKFEGSAWSTKDGYPSYGIVYVDNIELVNLYYDISGYVTNNLNNSVSAATITLNNSGGSTTSNDTGYYEITGIESGTYLITATSPTHNDYSDTVSITTDTEKNISMTRLTPALSNVGIIDSSESTLRIGWKENAVVDSVRIYQSTNTNLIATVDTPYISLASYTVSNLDADAGYNFWLEPWDGAVSGNKYYVSGTTDGDGGGGGGGGGGGPTPTATGTPSSTAPPWTNITDEDWLNLTRYEQEYILFEHDQLNITIGTYTLKPVNLSFWYLILFLGICSTAYGSQKKNGEVLFVVGLVAVFISIIKLGLF